MQLSTEASIVFKTFENIKKEENLLKYAEIADSYDKGIQEIGYLDPEIVAKQLKNQNIPSDSLIADVGCGTGLSGLELQKLGFNNLIGLDPSKEMRDIAEPRNLYRELKEFFLLSEQVDEHVDLYDALVCVGVLRKIHVSPEAVNDLCRILKPGGIAVFNVKQDGQEFLDCAKKLEEEGKWTLLHIENYRKYDDFAQKYQNEELTKYFYPMDAVVMVYKKI